MRASDMGGGDMANDRSAMPAPRTDEEPVYEYDVFLSYARHDEEHVKDVVRALRRAANVKVFFAPQALVKQEVDKAGDLLPGWQGILSEWLVRCCHLVAVATPAFLDTPWCDLEYCGFLNIRRHNPSRKMFVITPGEGFRLPPTHGEWDAVVPTGAAAADLVRRTVAMPGPRLRKPVWPRRCFGPLPLRAVTYRRGVPWNEGPPGIANSIEPPYELFLAHVRELMLRIKRGVPLDRVVADCRRAWGARADLAEDSLHAATTLLRMGQRPDGEPFDDGVRESADTEPGPPRPPETDLRPALDPETRAALARSEIYSAMRYLFAPEVDQDRIKFSAWDHECVDPAFGLYKATCRYCGSEEFFEPRVNDRPSHCCPNCDWTE